MPKPEMYSIGCRAEKRCEVIHHEQSEEIQTYAPVLPVEIQSVIE